MGIPGPLFAGAAALAAFAVGVPEARAAKPPDFGLQPLTTAAHPLTALR